MDIETANRLVALRRDHGLSQEELAAKLGVSRQAVSKWERAESSPDTDNLIALARLYGISLDALLLPGGPEPSAATPEEREEAEIFAAAQAWDAADQEESLLRRARLHAKLVGFPLPILIVLVYLALGFRWDWWHPGWIIFLLIPLYYWGVEWLLGDGEDDDEDEEN